MVGGIVNIYCDSWAAVSLSEGENTWEAAEGGAESQNSVWPGAESEEAARIGQVFLL